MFFKKTPWNNYKKQKESKRTEKNNSIKLNLVLFIAFENPKNQTKAKIEPSINKAVFKYLDHSSFKEGLEIRSSSSLLQKALLPEKGQVSTHLFF